MFTDLSDLSMTGLVAGWLRPGNNLFLGLDMTFIEGQLALGVGFMIQIPHIFRGSAVVLTRGFGREERTAFCFCIHSGQTALQ